MEQSQNSNGAANLEIGVGCMLLALLLAQVVSASRRNAQGEHKQAQGFPAHTRGRPGHWSI